MEERNWAWKSHIYRTSGYYYLGSKAADLGRAQSIPYEVVTSTFPYIDIDSLRFGSVIVVPTTSLPQNPS